jgi:hypothetical protein
VEILTFINRECQKEMYKEKGLNSIISIMIRRFFLGMFLIGIYASPVFSESFEFKSYEGEGVTVKYEQSLKPVVKKVARIYPKIKSDLERKLSLEVTFQPTVFLISNAPAFRQLSGGNELITAFAISRNNTIVIDYSKMEKTPFDLELTVKHELCHLLLRNFIQKNHLPRWLNEGISQWVSEGVTDIINPDGSKIFKQAVLSNNFLALKDISLSFPRRKELFILSYEESKSFIDYLENRYGEDKLIAILYELQKGNDIENTFSSVLSVDLARLEKDWHRHLRRKYTWVRYISDNIYWLLFFTGAIITVIGYLHLRRRMRKYREEEEEDEKL